MKIGSGTQSLSDSEPVNAQERSAENTPSQLVPSLPSADGSIAQAKEALLHSLHFPTFGVHPLKQLDSDLDALILLCQSEAQQEIGRLRSAAQAHTNVLTERLEAAESLAAERQQEIERLKVIIETQAAYIKAAEVERNHALALLQEQRTTHIHEQKDDAGALCATEGDAHPRSVHADSASHAVSTKAGKNGSLSGGSSSEVVDSIEVTKPGRPVDVTGGWLPIESLPELQMEHGDRPRQCLLYGPSIGVREGNVAGYASGYTFAGLPNVSGNLLDPDSGMAWSVTHWRLMPPASQAIDGLAPQELWSTEQVSAELQSLAAWIRRPGNIDRDDAIDECARVIENRARQVGCAPVMAGEASATLPSEAPSSPSQTDSMPLPPAPETP